MLEYKGDGDGVQYVTDHWEGKQLVLLIWNRERWQGSVRNHLSANIFQRKCSSQDQVRCPVQSVLTVWPGSHGLFSEKFRIISVPTLQIYSTICHSQKPYIKEIQVTMFPFAYGNKKQNILVNVGLRWKGKASKPKRRQEGGHWRVGWDFYCPLTIPVERILPLRDVFWPLSLGGILTS